MNTPHDHDHNDVAAPVIPKRLRRLSRKLLQASRFCRSTRDPKEIEAGYGRLRHDRGLPRRSTRDPKEIEAEIHSPHPMPLICRSTRDPKEIEAVEIPSPRFLRNVGRSTRDPKEIEAAMGAGFLAPRARSQHP